jgi:hypothetical protein
MAPPFQPFFQEDQCLNNAPDSPLRLKETLTPSQHRMIRRLCVELKEAKKTRGYFCLLSIQECCQSFYLFLVTE